MATRGRPLRPIVLSTVNSGLSPPSPPPAQTPVQRTPVTQGADRCGSAPRPGPCPLFQELKNDRVSFLSRPGAMPIHPLPRESFAFPKGARPSVPGPPSDCYSLDGCPNSGVSSLGYLVTHDSGKKLSWFPTDFSLSLGSGTGELRGCCWSARALEGQRDGREGWLEQVCGKSV